MPSLFCLFSLPRESQVYWPYLLMNKKRYAGLLWTKVEKYDKMDTKGLETVRRDNCLLVRKVTTATVVALDLIKEPIGKCFFHLTLYGLVQFGSACNQ